MAKKVEIYATPHQYQIDALKFMSDKSDGVVSYGTGTGKSLIQAIGALKYCSDDSVVKTVILGTKGAIIALEECFDEHTNFEPTPIGSYDDFVKFMMTPGRGICLFQYETLIDPLRLGTFNVLVKPEYPADSLEKKLDDMDGGCYRQRRKGREYRIETRLQQRDIESFEEVLEVIKVPKALAFDEEKVAWIANLFRLVPTAVFCDEVQKLINPNSGLGYLMRYIRPLIPKLWGFTATPVMAKLDQLYKLLEFIHPGCLGSEEYFKRTFFQYRKKRIGKRKHVHEIVNYQNLELLKQLVSRVMITYFPDKDVRFTKVTSRLRDWSEYDTIAEGLMEVDGKDPSSTSFRMNALQGLVDKTPEKVELLLGEIKNTYDKGVIVFCFLHDTIDYLKDVFDNTCINYKVLSGKQSKSAQKNTKKWFTEDASNKVLIISPAGGQSFNLQATPNMLIYDIPQAIGAFVQLIGRIVREGSEYSTFYIKMLVMEDTIDDYKYEYVSANRDMIKTMFDNDVIPVGTFEGYNCIIMEKLRNRMLWRK